MAKIGYLIFAAAVCAHATYAGVSVPINGPIGPPLGKRVTKQIAGVAPAAVPGSPTVEGHGAGNAQATAAGNKPGWIMAVSGGGGQATATQTGSSSSSSIPGIPGPPFTSGGGGGLVLNGSGNGTGSAASIGQQANSTINTSGGASIQRPKSREIGGEMPLKTFDCGCTRKIATPFFA